MMATVRKPRIHITKKPPNKWGITFEKTGEAMILCQTKKEALIKGKQFSSERDVPLMVHKANGKFQKKR